MRLLRGKTGVTRVRGPFAEVEDELQDDDGADHREGIVNSVIDLVEVLTITRLIEARILERDVDGRVP